jgi:hypothetical protein
MILDQEDALLFFDYNPETGDLIRKGNVGRSINSTQRKTIKVNGVAYPAQRLCWLIRYGHWPYGTLTYKGTNVRNNYDLMLDEYEDNESVPYKGMPYFKSKREII